MGPSITPSPVNSNVEDDDRMEGNDQEDKVAVDVANFIY